MSNGFLHASIQANATRDAAAATRQAAIAQIRYAKSVRKEDEERLAQCIKEYANLNESSLFHISDKELAMFQAEYPPESPQYVLALNEWNRRLVVRQIKEARFSTIIGLVGIVIGVVLGWLLAAYPAPRLRGDHTDDTKPINISVSSEPSSKTLTTVGK